MSVQTRLSQTGATVALVFGIVFFAAAEPRRWTGAEHFAIPLHDWSRADGNLIAQPFEFGAGWGNGRARLYKSMETVGAEGEFETRFTIRLESYEKPNRKAALKPAAEIWLGMKSRTPSARNVWIFPPMDDLVVMGINDAGEFYAGEQKVETSMDLSQPIEVRLSGTVGTDGDQLTVAADQEGAEPVELNLALPGRTLSGALCLMGQGVGTRWNFGRWILEGSAVATNPDHSLGPVLWSQYTRQDDGTVKLQAQMVPLEERDSQTAELQIREEGTWETVAQATYDPMSSTFLFPTQRNEPGAVPYRVVYVYDGEETSWDGIIRANPEAEDEFTLGVFNCDKGILFPMETMMRNVSIQDPDLLFFAGDQFYENMDSVRIIRTPLEASRLSYLNKWYQFGIAYRSLLRDRPSVILPDDHDVFMGNIWGHGGEGYVMEPAWVNIVHRTMCGTLPDPVDPAPLENGISVYFTALDYAGMSFAVIADRMFKTDPKKIGLRARGIKDPNELDVEGAQLLGKRQLAFLESWTKRTEDLPVRWFLSQTMFSKANTHTGSLLKRSRVDMDNNGWPQSARNRALRTLGRDTIMVHGDQHIGVLARLGIEAFDDGPLAFMVTGSCVGFPRAWWPDMEPQDGLLNGIPHTGRYFDDLGNRLTVLGATNPKGASQGEFSEGWDQISAQGAFVEQDAKGSGHGLIIVDKANQAARFEAYRLDFDAAKPMPTDQFEGFPVTLPLR